MRIATEELPNDFEVCLLCELFQFSELKHNDLYKSNLIYISQNISSKQKLLHEFKCTSSCKSITPKMKRIKNESKSCM